MRRFSCLGTILVTLFLLVGLGWLGVTLVGRSFVQDGMSEDQVPGLRAEAAIIRDENGVPYITAKNEEDAYAALGYAHAQDRLWQMDVARRAGEGRLSEIFGRRTIGYDAMLRTIGFKRVAEQILKEMPAKTRRVLEAYANGVNAFIASHSAYYPFEFDALSYRPEKWTPLHTVMITRLMAWELNSSFWSDIVYAEIRDRVDSASFSEILPHYPSDSPTIIPGGQHPEPLLEALERPPIDTIRTAPTDSTTRDTVRRDTVRRDTARRSTLSDVFELEQSMRTFLGMGGSHVGSNGWAVSGARSTGGRPMLANDPHLAHSAPARWYQAVINIGDRWIAGATIAGCPFVVIGRNNDIAWGITSMIADETDFYVEQLDSARKNKILHDGVWEQTTLLRDTIGVKDSASVPISIRIGRHGPLISDVHPFASAFSIGGGKSVPADTAGIFARSAIAMRWTGQDPSQEMAAWQGMNNARNLAQFTEATRLGGIPSLNFVYADRNGDIATIPSARIPIREAGSPNLPNPGTESRFNWKGTIPASKLPTLVNPERGYVAAANNKISNSLPFHISDLWEDPSRAFRLDQLLGQGNLLSQVDFVQMQGDQVSPHMRYMVDFLLRAFPDSVKQGSAVREALARLRGWDGGMLVNSAEAAIVAEWFQAVIELTYRDELGPTTFAHFCQLASMPIRSIRYHLMIDSRWFDDVATPNRRETRDDILRRALGRALESLHTRFNTWTVGLWRYGALHTVTFRHPFSDEEALRTIVNIGPFEIGGSNTTLNNGEWGLNSPFDVRLGPSMRQIVDFADTATYLRTVIPTGESGQPLSQFYKNQSVLYLANGYLSLRAALPPESAVSSRVDLRPAASE
jgi:penicillin amidase